MARSIDSKGVHVVTLGILITVGAPVSGDITVVGTRDPEVDRSAVQETAADRNWRKDLSKDGDIHHLDMEKGYLRRLLFDSHVKAKKTKNPVEETARRFLARHRPALGIESPAFELSPRRIHARGERTSISFEQNFAGLPVFASSVVLQVNDGNISYMSADVLTDDDIIILEELANHEMMSGWDARVIGGSLEGEDLSGPATVMVYCPHIVENLGEACFVYQIDLEKVPERILIDACSGEVVLRYPLWAGLHRIIFDLECQQEWGDEDLARVEGERKCGIRDADLAYEYIGDCYDFFLCHFGRLGIDNEDSPITCLVRYSPALGVGYICDWDGAFWHRIDRYMAIGGGSIADDIVGHEYMHGVTQAMSGIIYLNQSGALNEHFSDVFGEFVDQTNDSGDDSEQVKWLMGEDAIEGANRNMADPPSYSHPDRMGSEYWHVVSGYTADSGYVHYNNGVGNKLCYLLTDGDTFNGYTVEGMGIDMIAALYYEILEGLLVQAPCYKDLYFALKQAAINLDWTYDQKENLERACRAVEIAVDSDYKRYVATDLPVEIPEYERIESRIVVDDQGFLDDINVGVELVYLWVGELDLTVVSPSGTSAVLFDENATNGLSRELGISTEFDDEAPAAVSEVIEPFDGTYRPIEQLSAFKGENVAGIWTLKISDCSTSETRISVPHSNPLTGETKELSTLLTAKLLRWSIEIKERRN